MEKLALIILNYNSIEDCITCVEQLKSFKGKFHIVIVDNNSPDGSFKNLREKYGAETYIDVIQTGSNRGYSSGNNYGIKYAIDKYHVDTVGILNPDVLIPEIDILKCLMERLYADESYALIGGMPIDINKNYNPNRAGWKIPTAIEIIKNHCLGLNNKRYTATVDLKMETPKLAQVDCVAGCFFLAKVSHMEKLGFLDENVFLYNEENILGIKCRLNGYKEVIALDQFYFHNHKYNKKKKVSFKEKIQATQSSYLSSRYLLQKYYSKKMLPILWWVERYNRLFLTGAYLKNIFK